MSLLLKYIEMEWETEKHVGSKSEYQGVEKVQVGEMSHAM